MITIQRSQSYQKMMVSFNLILLLLLFNIILIPLDDSRIVKQKPLKAKCLS